MKLLILAVLLSPLIASATTSTSASAAKETVMRLDPWWPVHCEKHDYPLVNRVSPVEKLQETKSQVTFGFSAIVGACDEGQFVSREISPAATTQTERSKIILFQKTIPVISETNLIAPNIAYVRVTFDKASIFKKKERANFWLSFYPNGYVAPYVSTNSWGRTVIYPSPSIRFLWKAEVSRVSAEETQMRVLLN